MMVGDVVLLSNLVRRERETVTDLVMEANMMDMLGVRETSCVGAIIVSSLDSIIMQKMTAVRGHHQSPLNHQNLSQEFS